MAAAADIGGKRFLYQEIFLQNLLCSDHETDMESDFENSPPEQLIRVSPTQDFSQLNTILQKCD